MDLDRYRVLLLDRTYRPLRAVTWRRAILLDLSGRIEVLAYYDRVIRTPSARYALPAVIRAPGWLDRYERGRTVALTRRNVLLRDGHVCAYCGGAHDLTIDHVVPRSRGGRTVWDNVVAACAPCNRRKGDRTPDEVGMVLRTRPVAPTALQFGRRGMFGMVDPPAEWRAWLG